MAQVACSGCQFSVACVTRTMGRPHIPVEGEMVRCVRCGATWRIKVDNYQAGTRHVGFDEASTKCWIEKYDTTWMKVPWWEKREGKWLGKLAPGCPRCRHAVCMDSNGLEILRCRVVSAYYGCFDAGIVVSGAWRYKPDRREYHLVYRVRRSWIWSHRERDE